MEQKKNYTAYDLLREFPHTTFKSIIVDDELKKTPIGLAKGRLSMSDEELKKHQFELNEWFEVQPMRSENLFIIDVDEKNKKIEEFLPALKNTVWFETNKGYHYYIYINDFPKDKIIENEVKIFNDTCPDTDLLHFKKSVWEKKDRISPNNTIEEFKFSEIAALLKPGRILNKPEVKPEIKPEVKPEIKPEVTLCNEITKLLNLLDDDKVDDYTEWLKVAQICKNEKYPFSLFDAWSSKSDYYNEAENMKIWDNLNDLEDCRGTPVTIATLHKMAKEDNPSKYKKLFNRVEIDRTYDTLKGEFEKTHFKISAPYALVNIDRSGDLVFKNKADFKNTYENLFFESIDKKGDIVKTNFADSWLKDPNIKTYEKIDFLPSGCQEYIYNLYTGLNAENLNVDVDNFDLSPIKFHIEHILCNGDSAGYEYFYKWLAQIVQDPGYKPGVALVFISGQGAGKNTFFDWFGNKVLGTKYYTSTADIDYICGRFAPGLKNKLLVNLDETSGKETFANSNRLKNLITSNTIQYEKKGVDTINLNDFSRFVFTSNNNVPVKIEQDDRRFVVFECSDKYLNNKEYFTKLYDWLNKDANVKAFYNYLMSIDISKFNWQGERPKTEIYEELRSVNIPLAARFITELYQKRTSDMTTIKAKEFFDKFNNWLISGNYDIKFNSTSFGLQIKKIDGITKRRNLTGQIYTIDFNKVFDYLDKNKFIEKLDEIDEIDE